MSIDWIYDHEQLGTEFDWLASDDAGHLAYLSTAGRGPMPAPVAARANETDAAIDALLRLPAAHTFQVYQPERLNIDDWLEMAARGVFAYDWCHASRRYQLVAEPDLPITLADVPPSADRLARACAFPGRFTDRPRLGPNFPRR